METDAQIASNTQAQPKSPKKSSLIVFIVILIVLVMAALSSFVTYFLIKSQFEKRLNAAEMQNSTLNSKIQNLNKQVKQLEDEKQKVEEKKSANVCVDTDGGQDHSIKGTIKFKEFDSSGSVIATSDVSDSCIEAIINGESKQNVLREYYCDSNNKVQYEHFVCPKGCLNGACIQ